MGRPIILAALTAALAFAAAPAKGADPPRIGVLVVGGDAETAAARAGLAEGLRLAGLSASTIERAVAAGDVEPAEAIHELQREGVQVIAAVGSAASRLAHAAVRDRFVVCTAVDEADVPELRRGGAACVVAGATPDVVVAELRRVAPELRRVGVFVPAGDEAAQTNARDLAGVTDVVVAQADGATPEARAADAVAKLVPGTDAVWLPPSVPPADASALAKAFERRGIPLVGSRRSHLDAGCAVVVRADPRVLGELAAVFVHELLAGADAGKLPLRRARRRLVEVSLPAAARLDFRVPLTLLAWADSVVRPRTVRR